jgi:predicted RNA-binding Zn-ribbon protein involved in translation (DUF1610 family)
MYEEELQCEHCNGTMEYDNKKRMFVCPYCGSSKIFAESDEVKLARMRNQEKQIDLERQRLFYQQQNMKKTEEKNKKFLILWIIGWICFFPIPLTILIVRNKNLDTKTKTLIIFAVWAFILLVYIFTDKDELNQTRAERNYRTSDNSYLVEMQSDLTHRKEAEK